jgi:metal-responsive CopG/Arc/MetJ family transcriptional regulator
MKSKVTIRLPDDLEEDLSALTKRLRLKRSDIVRIAIQRFIEESKTVKETIPYERVVDIIGTVSSGIPDLGEANRRHLVKKIKKYA